MNATDKEGKIMAIRGKKSCRKEMTEFQRTGFDL